VVEDHALGGGLGDAVGAAIGSLAPVHRLAVTRIPRSGTGEELLEYCGISHRSIERKVRELLAAADR